MAILIDEGIEFYHRVRRNKDYKSLSHFHEAHELYYLAKGSSRYFIDNEIYMLNAGDMIFVPKGAFHKTNIEHNKDAERIILVFNDDFAGEDYAEYLKQMSENKHIRFAPAELSGIEDILYKIEYESKHKMADYTRLQRLYLRELLIHIHRHRIREDKSASGASFAFIDSIIKYISENVDADLSLSALSKKYSVSPNHLSKQFKKVSGLLLSEYINISRVSAAEKLLEGSDDPITVVATKCGFNDSNYFAAVFKRYKGITPKKYAMRNREKC